MTVFGRETTGHGATPASWGPGSKYALRSTIVALALWWIGLFAWGFPHPKYDDIFFAGTAINLANGQGLSNPYVKSWMGQFQTEKFFVQPPFYPYLLFGWIKLWGLSAASLRAFPIVCCFGTGVCLVLLGRRAGLGWPGILVVSLLGSTHFLQYGLRPDAPGVLACGLAVLGWTGGSRRAWFCGSVFGAAAPFIHPFTAALVLPLGLWCMLRTASDGTDRVRGEAVSWRLALSLTAGGLVFALFLVAIDGQLTEFRRVFALPAALRTTGMGLQWHVLWEKMHVGWEPSLRWPTIGVLALGIILAGRQPASRQVAISATLVFLWFLVLGTMLYTAYVIRVLYLFAWLTAAFVGGRLSTSLRPAFGLLWILTALLMIFPGALSPFLSQPPAIDRARLKAQLGPLLLQHDRRLLLDEYAARYVFDWNLPPGAEDWLHCHWLPKSPNAPVRIARKSAADVWAVEACKLEALVPVTGETCERIVLFGYQTSLPQKPGDLRIVP